MSFSKNELEGKLEGKSGGVFLLTESTPRAVNLFNRRRVAPQDNENKFDMLVRNCVAHNGKKNPIQGGVQCFGTSPIVWTQISKPIWESFS